MKKHSDTFNLNFVKNFALYCALVVSVQQAQADESLVKSLTIEGAVDEALQQSPELGRAKATAEEMGWHRYETLASGFLPKITGKAHHYFDDKFSVTGIDFGGGPLNFQGFYPRDMMSLEFRLPVFNGLSNLRKLQSANRAVEAADQEVEFASFQLRQEVKLQFYRALAAEELRSVAEQNVKTLEDHLKQINNKKRGGVATNYDVLRIQVQLSDATTDLLDASDNLVIARKKLAELLGSGSDERPLKGALPVPNVEQVNPLQLENIKHRSDLRALELKAESSDYLRRASNSWFVPNISLGGEYGWYNSQFVSTSVTDTGVYRSAYNLGVYLEWNLFDGGEALARSREAFYRKVQADKTLEAATAKMPHDFEYWKRRYLAQAGRFAAKKLDIERSLESVRLAKEEEKAGSRTSSEVLDAELDLFRAKAGVVNALLNAVEARIRLELVLGREI